MGRSQIPRPDSRPSAAQPPVTATEVETPVSKAAKVPLPSETPKARKQEAPLRNASKNPHLVKATASASREVVSGTEANKKNKGDALGRENQQPSDKADPATPSQRRFSRGRRGRGWYRGRRRGTTRGTSTSTNSN